MLAVVSSPGMGRGWRSASELPEAQGSPGVQALPGPRCPALGPPPPPCRRRVRPAFSASPRVSRECVGEGRALGQLSVFSAAWSLHHVQPHPPCCRRCPASVRTVGRARLPAQRPMSSDQSCRPSWCKAAVSDAPRGVTRGPLRSREQATGTFIRAGNHVQAPGGAQPVPSAPSQCLRVVHVQRDWGFLSVFSKVVFTGFTCFTVLCLYRTAE